MKREQFLQDYSKYILNGKASVFIGSGLSCGAGYKNWEEFIKEFATDVGLDISKEHNFPQIAQYFDNKKGRTYINQRLMELFDDKVANPNKVFTALSRIPFASIWTTNYDTLIERSLDNSQKEYGVVTNDKSYSKMKKNSGVVVHKIHGTVHSPEECVVTEKDYYDLEQNNIIVSSELKAELCKNSFLFLGFSFSDFDIQTILQKIRAIFGPSFPHCHYFVFKKPQKIKGKPKEYIYQQNRLELFTDELSKLNIRTYLVDDYSEIELLLEDLRKKITLNNIFISGAYEEKTAIAPIAREITKSISEGLIENKLFIYSGLGKNLGADLIEGCFEGCSKLSSNEPELFNKRVHLFPFPYKSSKAKGDLYTRLRENMISNTSVSIIIGGEKKEGKKLKLSQGVEEEINISEAQGNLIIPIGSTGGVAKEKWNQMKKDYSSCTSFNSLMSNDVGEVTKAVLQIIDKRKIE